MNYFPEEVLEQVLGMLSSHGDRNSASVVCKRWYEVEGWSRRRVLIPNCYATTPQRLLSRFPRVSSLTLKGKPHFADYSHPWVQAMASARTNLQELCLKRMIVSDDTLRLISTAFPNFNSLTMISCQGFTTDGLASIASNCRLLRELDLQECEVDDERGLWLTQFPDTCTTLTCLNFACLNGQVSLPALERLVARCPELTTLKVNHSVPLESLNRILNLAPRLLHLGTGSFILHPHSKFESYSNFTKCTSIRSLTGFLRVSPRCLLPIYPLSLYLTSLNLSCAPSIRTNELVNLIRYCKNVERLWILDTIGDKGLGVVASTCKQLQELRVFPSERHQVTEEGLVAISAGCPNLNSILYFCHQMTNAALITVAKNCPNFVRFRLCTINPTVPDAVTQLPLDEGFGAIVQSCKGLKRLSISGHLTDQVLLYIGMYAEQLEMLSVAFAGETDKGMLYVLNGCKKLKKLEMRNSPFGDMALLADVSKYETMRSLWMSSCQVSLGACRTLARKMPRINVEIINPSRTLLQDPDDAHKVDKMYLYRSLAGPRKDAPQFVWTL